MILYKVNYDIKLYILKRIRYYIILDYIIWDYFLLYSIRWYYFILDYIILDLYNKRFDYFISLLYITWFLYYIILYYEIRL